MRSIEVEVEVNVLKVKPLIAHNSLQLEESTAEARVMAVEECWVSLTPHNVISLAVTFNWGAGWQ